MALPTTRDEVIDYVLRRLGAPVLEINVDPDQVEERIDDAFSFFQDFHYEATERVLLKHEVTQEDKDNQYIPTSPLVQAVFQIFRQPMGGTNMMSLDYHMRVQSINDIRNSNFISYQMAQSHLSMMRYMMDGNVSFRFSRYKHRLYIDTRWEQITPGQWFVVEAQRFLDPTEFNELWTDKMFLKLATAHVKQQWGTNMKKFQGMQLPGGIEMNGQQIFDEATAEIEKVEEEIKSMYQVPPALMVG